MIEHGLSTLDVVNKELTCSVKFQQMAFGLHLSCRTEHSCLSICPSLEGQILLRKLLFAIVCLLTM